MRIKRSLAAVLLLAGALCFAGCSQKDSQEPETEVLVTPTPVPSPVPTVNPANETQNGSITMVNDYLENKEKNSGSADAGTQETDAGSSQDVSKDQEASDTENNSDRSDDISQEPAQGSEDPSLDSGSLDSEE